jgi:hypothetical protein
MVEFAIISAYLYVCLGALLLYKTALLEGEGIGYAPYGLAAAKALILGKFILLGHALKIGGDGARRRLVVQILYKSLLLMLLLVVLTASEEGILAFIHGHSVTKAMIGLAGGTLGLTLATSFRVLLILIPYVAAREISLALGEGKLMQLLTQRRSPQAAA